MPFLNFHILSFDDPWSARILPFRILRGPLFHISVTGQELFFAVSYRKPALNYDAFLQKRIHYSHSVPEEVVPVNSLMLEATTLATQVFKRSYKIILDYKRTGMLCLALPACPKVLKLDFQSEFSISKIIRIFLNFFFIAE